MENLKMTVKEIRTLLFDTDKYCVIGQDVVELTKVYVNSDNQVYAGEWIDSKGVINFNSGYLPDLVTTIIIN